MALTAVFVATIHTPHASNQLATTATQTSFASLYQTSSGRTVAGTNRGLFVYDDETSTWNPVPALGRNVIYAIAEDRVATFAGGFSQRFVHRRQDKRLVWRNRSFTRVETGPGGADAAGSVRAIAQFRDATYFAIFGRGVERIEGGRSSLSWSNAPVSAREVISMIADGEDRLLIGTARDGVFSSDGKTIS